MEFKLSAVQRWRLILDADQTFTVHVPYMCVLVNVLQLYISY